MTNEYPQLLEIDVGECLWELAFTADGEHLVSGNDKGAQVWRVKDGQQVATMPMKNRAWCIAASRDGGCIAAGSWGEVFVWDATTFKQVFTSRSGSNIWDVDFSPDSTCLVDADFLLNRATIWDIAAGRKLRTLKHASVKIAKYSPRGNRIATASRESVRVWDSTNGRLLVEVEVGVESHHGLLWHNNHLFALTNRRQIKQIDASTGSTISEWPAPNVDSDSCIALPSHGKFIAYSAGGTIAFLDTSTNTQLSSIQHIAALGPMSFSFDGQLLVITAGRRIIIKDTSSVVFCPTSEPQLDIDTAILDAWKYDQLTDAEVLLSAAIRSRNNVHHALASRSLVRSRLGHWDAALIDAKQSITIQRSLHAYVAKSVALVGKGEKDEAIRVCDIAFEHFHLEHVSLLLLVKAVILFMAGDHVDAMTRMNDLITDSARAPVDPAFYQVQAYMHLLLGNKHMESSNYEYALQSFEDARIKLGHRTRQPPLIVSLISGWSFDFLGITIQQRICEALLAAGRTQEAVERAMQMLGEDIDMTEPTVAWFSDLKRRCLRKLEDLGDNAINANQYDEAISQYTVALHLDPPDLRGLLVKRSKAYAEQGKWKDALKDANKIIKLDPTSPSGYERKYAALLVTYGERDKALGRMLSQLLTSSGDTSILAWTGMPGSFNSCLPMNIAVFREPSTSYIPPTIPDTEMTTITAALRASSLNLVLVTKLHDQLSALPLPSFLLQRMKLPCLAFKVRVTTLTRRGSETVFRAQAGALGAVEIKTRQNIVRADPLYLINPWIDFLLDRHPTAPQEGKDFEFDESPSLDSPQQLSRTLNDTSTPSSIVPLVDKQMEFLARLRQPFGALFLVRAQRDAPEFRRITTENVITVQVQEFTSATLNNLIQGVRVLDVL